MRAVREDSVGLVIDIQERLLPAIADGEKTTGTVVKFIQGLHILQVPILAVRHYPKGLGDLVPDIRRALGEYTPMDKVTFSAYENADIATRLRALGRKNLFVAGMEAHVCVLQSVIDFVHAGYNTFVLGDGIASRNPYDKEMALWRAEREGAYPTSCEAALFELQREAGTDRFRAICALVK